MPDAEAREYREGQDKAHRIRTASFFQQILHTAAKQLTEEWDEARSAYEGEPNADKRNRTNLWRGKIDTQAAYTDEQPPKTRIQPSPGLVNDEVAKNRAQCDEQVYAYLHRELEYRAEFGKMRHSADLTAVGVVAHYVDERRNMPAIRYLENEQVAIDGDCGGDLTKAGWVAYYEWVAPEILHRQYPNIPLEDLNKAARHASSLGADSTANMSGDEALKRQRAYAEAGEVLSKCKLWKMYCRGEYALYDQAPKADEQNEEGKPHFERFRERHDMNEYRRYVELVEGYPEPLQDADDWPEAMALGYDEWPITVLRYNEAHNEFWPQTDWRYEQALCDDFEAATGDMCGRMALRGLKFAAREGCTLTAAKIRTIYETPGVDVIKGALDSQGNPYIKLMDRPELSDADLGFIDTLRELYTLVSGTPRVRTGSEEEEKTATATRIEAATGTARTNVRLRRFERALAESARKTMQIAHTILPRLTVVETFQSASGGPSVDAYGETVEGSIEPMHSPRKLRLRERVSWADAQELLRDPEAELVLLGVEAMVGADLAKWWQQNVPLCVLRQNTRVTVERGSTQEHTRLERAATLREIFQTVLMPLAEATGDINVLIEAAKKILSLLDLEEFEGLVPQARAIAPPEEAPATEASTPPAEPVYANV